MVAGGILPKASSVGANTVNSPPLRVLTRLTLGLSWPDSAAVSVVSSGLFDAATVTGSAAIPMTEPGPTGTWRTWSPHPGPTGSAVAVAADRDSIPEAATATAAAATAARVVVPIDVISLCSGGLTPPRSVLTSGIRCRAAAGWAAPRKSPTPVSSGIATTTIHQAVGSELLMSGYLDQRWKE